MAALVQSIFSLRSELHASTVASRAERIPVAKRTHRSAFSGLVSDQSRSFNPGLREVSLSQVKPAVRLTRTYGPTLSPVRAFKFRFAAGPGCLSLAGGTKIQSAGAKLSVACRIPFAGDRLYQHCFTAGQPGTGTHTSADGASNCLRRQHIRYRPHRGDRMILWLLLAACGSVLLCSFTNHLSQNVAAIPLLWIIPLIAYLLSFVWAFNGPRSYPRYVMLGLLAISTGIAGLSAL